MNKIYSRIDWKNYPNTSTALNETNLNRMDKAIDDLDNRVIEQDSTKADQTTVNNMVKNWTMDETTGVITVEKQDGSKIMFDLNIEKIPVDFEMSPSGILTMTTSDGTQFTANIGSMIPVLTFNESDQIAVSVSGSGVNKTYSFTVKDGSITGSKLQPNYLADIKSESAKAKMSETNAEKFKNESEKIYEAMKRLEHKIEVNENEPSDLNVNDEWLNFYGTGSDFNKAKNYVKTAEGYKLLSRWTSSDTVDVNGKTLTGVVDELKKTSQNNGYGEVAGGKNLLNPTWETTTHHGITFTNNNDGSFKIKGSHEQGVSSFTKSILVPVEIGKSYKIIGKCIAVYKKDNSTYIIENRSTINESIFKATEDAVNICLYVSGYETNVDLITTYMLTESTNTSEYEPYFPSNKMLAEETSQQSTEMMDIKMLGWSVPRECPIQNEVNGNQFIQKVGRADMSKLAWSTYSSTGIFRFSSESGAEYTKYNIKQGSFAYLRDYNYVGNFTSWSDISNYGNKTIMGVFVGGNDDGFILTNNAYTNSFDFKQAMQGQYLYYELATYNTITIDGNEEVVEIKQDVGDVQSTLTTVISDIANIRNDYVSKLYYTNRNTPYVTADENAIVATSTGSASMSPKLINETLAEIAVTGADINNIVFDEQLKCTGLSVNIPDDGVTRYIYIETSTELQPYVKTGIFRLTQQSTGSKVTIRNIDGYSYYETTRGLSGTIPIIIPQGTKLSGETYIFVYITDKLKTPLDERFMSLGRSTYNNIDNIKTTQNELNTILADINTYMGTISETSSDYKIGSYLQSVVQKLVDLSISK